MPSDLLSKKAFQSEVPAYSRAALDQLVLLDPDFGTIEVQAGPLAWRTRPAGFAGFLQTIMGQQISHQAAAAIWKRLAQLPGALAPDGMLALSDDALRGAGLSRPKVAHARSLASAIVAGRLDPAALPAMDDEAAIASISAVRGLGRWTAEVYLIFAEQRMDVFPAGDIAVANALTALKSLPMRPKEKSLREIAEPWRPYRALAARLLWHHWRHLTGRPSMDDPPLA